MSIWCSGEEIGYDPFDRSKAERGEVRSYAVGFSNHYPTQDLEQPASLAIAHIPAWCVPGHEGETDDFDAVGEFLRLDVDTAEHDYASGGTPTGERIHASVVLDVKAARALADDLIEWLQTPKARTEKGQAS